MQQIESILDNVAPIPSKSKELIIAGIKEVAYKKGHVILDSKKVETKIYFIKKGILRAYSPTKNGEVTFWFGKEGDCVISMKSYVANEKSYEKVELVENAELYEISIKKLRELFNVDIHVANWGRRFAEKELLRTEERFVSREFKTATERYRDLMDKDPELLKRVPLGHIATYLGITQVSLSRVRSKFK